MRESQDTPHRPKLRQAGAEKPPLFEVSGEYDGRGWLVTLRGELDLSNVTALEDELRRAEGSEAESIVVDLSGLEFLDSSGLHALVQAARRSRKSGERLRLVPAPDRVQAVFRLTNTEHHLPFIDHGSD